MALVDYALNGDITVLTLTMIATLSQLTPDAVEGMKAFVEKRAERLRAPRGTR